jgi:toxin ParE1/3/4
MKLVFTHAALEDLRSIRAYTLETWGPEQETRYLDKMWAKFDSLRQDPDRYRQRPDLFPGCRIAAEGKHVILFRVGHEQLEVVRVLHSAMDFKRHLSSDEKA